MIKELTQRQFEVLELVSLGHSHKEIAIRLGISHHTLKHHFAELYLSLGALNGPHAVRITVERGVLKVKSK